MKKLIFRYGTMAAAKSLNLITTNYNFNELGLSTIVVVPNSLKTAKVKSRVGMEICGIHFSKLKEYISTNKVDCILVDEAQFLSEDEVKYLSLLSLTGVTVIAYGLRTTFKGELFEGSKWLLALADDIEEIPTLCNCGRKARMNLRLVNGKVDKSNDIIKLREEESVAYVSVCRECYYKYYNNLIDSTDIIKYDNTIKCK